MRECVEFCRRLSIHDLGIRREIPPFLVVRYEIMGRVVADLIPLTTLPCNYGGERPYFICPSCGRRREYLYLPPFSERLLCRDCHGLSYILIQVRRTRHEPLFRAIMLERRFLQYLDNMERGKRPYHLERMRESIERRFARLYGQVR